MNGSADPQDRTIPQTAAAVAEVVRRAQGVDGVGKDPAAFAELIRRYERTLLSIAYAALGDADRAGDVVQEAFVRAWERLSDLQDPARFGPWLCGIARNLATDVRRRLRLQPKPQTDLAARAGESDESGGAFHEAVAPDRLAPDPAEALGRKESRQLVTAALDELDETTRTVMVMRYYDELPSKAIGELLGLSPAAVDMRLSRARQQLRRKLAAAHGASSEGRKQDLRVG